MTKTNDVTKKTLLALSFAAAASTVQASDAQLKDICKHETTIEKLTTCENLVSELIEIQLSKTETVSNETSRIRDMLVNSNRPDYSSSFAEYVENRYGVRNAELEEMMEEVSTRIVRDFTCARIGQGQK